MNDASCNDYSESVSLLVYIIAAFESRLKCFSVCYAIMTETLIHAI